jgi:hypothetical protein
MSSLTCALAALAADLKTDPETYESDLEWPGFEFLRALLARIGLAV